MEQRRLEDLELWVAVQQAVHVEVSNLGLAFGDARFGFMVYGSCFFVWVVGYGGAGLEV